MGVLSPARTGGWVKERHDGAPVGEANKTQCADITLTSTHLSTSNYNQNCKNGTGVRATMLSNGMSMNANGSAVGGGCEYSFYSTTSRSQPPLLSRPPHGLPSSRPPQALSFVRRSCPPLSFFFQGLPSAPASLSLLSVPNRILLYVRNGHISPSHRLRSNY